MRMPVKASSRFFLPAAALRKPGLTAGEFCPRVHAGPAVVDRRGERGVAVIVVLALLALILLYVGANARTLHHLGRELRLVEQQQIQRLVKPVPKTNSVSRLTTLTPASQP